MIFFSLQNVYVAEETGSLEGSCCFVDHWRQTCTQMMLLEFLKRVRGGSTDMKKTNSVVRVRERTTLTERPPLVGKVIANFCG
jgi:hypothetical protein